MPSPSEEPVEGPQASEIVANDPFWSVVRRRHPDVDIVVLPPNDVPDPTPGTGETPVHTGVTRADFEGDVTALWDQSMRGVCLVIAAMVVLVGCASEPNKEDSMVSVEQMHEQVTQGVRDLADALTAAGLGVPSASGRYVACGIEPVSSVQYRAGVTVAGAGDASATVEQAAQALVESGWEITDSGTQVDEAWSNLKRGAITASVRVPDGQDGDVSIGVVHPCVEADREVVDEALGQTDQIIG